MLKNKNIVIYENKSSFVKKIKKALKGQKVSLIFVNSKNIKKINKCIEQADALINIPRLIFDKKLLRKARKLKWIHIGGAGIETFLFEEFVKSRVLFTNGKIIQGPSVSDHAVAILLAFTRNLNGQIKNLKYEKMNRPIELKGKVCGVFGVGGIGQLVSEKLNSFGMKIIGFNDDLVPISHIYSDIFLYDKLIKKAGDLDVLICCAPLTKKTENFFDEKIFSKMKKDSIFINVSRGGLVKTNCFKNKKISSKFRGIGLDVTDPEPLPKNNFLRKMNNVLLTDHTAGPSDKNRERSLDLMLENLRRFLNNLNLLNIVDKKKGY